jgi:hypothetical protein
MISWFHIIYKMHHHISLGLKVEYYKRLPSITLLYFTFWYSIYLEEWYFHRDNLVIFWIFIFFFFLVSLSYVCIVSWYLYQNIIPRYFSAFKRQGKWCTELSNTFLFIKEATSCKAILFWTMYPLWVVIIMEEKVTK